MFRWPITIPTLILHCHLIGIALTMVEKCLWKLYSTFQVPKGEFCKEMVRLFFFRQKRAHSLESAASIVCIVAAFF